LVQCHIFHCLDQWSVPLGLATFQLNGYNNTQSAVQYSSVAANLRLLQYCRIPNWGLKWYLRYACNNSENSNQSWNLLFVPFTFGSDGRTANTRIPLQMQIVVPKHDQSMSQSLFLLRKSIEVNIVSYTKEKRRNQSQLVHLPNIQHEYCQCFLAASKHVKPF